MPESDELTSAFVELEALVRQNSRMPGLAAAQSEARRRRGRRVAWVAAGMVVLVLAGVASVVPGWLRRSGPPVLNPSPSATTGTPSPSAATPSPTATPEPAPAAVMADMTPPERIRNATLDVPAFDLAGCPSGRLQFVETSFSSSDGGVLLEYAAVGDVDRDGLEDILVALRCGPATGEHGVSGTQVVAYSGPALILLGSVPTGDLTIVSSLLVRPNGDVELGMAQTGLVQAIAFDRYRWTGSRFELVESVDVPADAMPVVALSAEPPVIQLAPGAPAQRVVVTIRNDGPTSALPLQLTIIWTDSVSIDVEAFAGTTAQARHDLLIAAPGAGETVTVALHAALLAGATVRSSEILLSIYGHRDTEGASDRFTVNVLAA